MGKKFRTIYSEMPSELISLYNQLQLKLNEFLSIPKYRKILLEYDDSLIFTGDRQKIGSALGNPHKKWDNIPNAAWYGRMVYENLRQILLSQQETTKICQELEKNNWVYSEDVKDSLNNQGIYPTSSRISNLIKYNKVPELVYKKGFIMDYSCSDVQNCKQINKTTFLLKYSGEDWVEYKIPLPVSIRKEATQNIAKPCFVKSKDLGYIGLVRYEVEYNKIDHNNNILGVDLGKIKLFSAITLYKNGSYSNEYVPSKELAKLKNKLEVLYKKRSDLTDKQNRVETNNKGDLRNEEELLWKYRQRETEKSRITNKITRLKLVMARLMACEIVDIAKKEKCKEIHMENLSWLESVGGKWNFSEIKSSVQNLADLEGIKVLFVNARHSSSEHPVTMELGKKINRIVRFINGYEIDRDVLAAINIASRSKYGKPRKVTSLRDKHTSTPKRVNRGKSTRKEYIKELVSSMNKEKTKDLIVTLAPDFVPDGNRWVVSDKIETKSNTCLFRGFKLLKTVTPKLSEFYEF